MFLDGSEACSYQNSETPMPQSAVDGQLAYLNSVGTAFDQGNAALNDLVLALGGSPNNTSEGGAGVPTTGTLDLSVPGIPVVPSANYPVSTRADVNDPAFWAWALSPRQSRRHWGPGGVPTPGGGGFSYSPTNPIVLPGGGSRYRTPKHGGMPRRYRNIPPVSDSCPTIIPLTSAVPPPSAPPQMPAAVAPPALPVTPMGPVADCRTGNICNDIRRGCVLASQVSPQQIIACAVAGYAGNLNLYPAIAAAGGADGGAYFGSVDLNPPPYSPSMGLGDTAQDANANLFSNSLEYAISGLVGALAVALLWRGKKK